MLQPARDSGCRTNLSRETHSHHRAVPGRQRGGRLNTETVRILALPDVKANYANLGLTAVSTTPEQFASYVQEEIVRWAKVVKASGARAD